jgi:uncharacterized protein (DUF302 family)
MVLSRPEPAGFDPSLQNGVHPFFLLNSTERLMGCAMTGNVSHADGLIEIQSSRSFAKTVANLLIALERRGMTMHARIDHAANAANGGYQISPCQVFVFNFPEAEGALLAECPLMGLDLPRKIAVRQDNKGGVWLSYNDPAWMGRRYHASPKVQSLLHAMANSFNGIVLEAGGVGQQVTAKHS